jgi:UDP-glucose 4-epimerase
MAFEENVNTVLTLCELARQGYFKTLIHCSTSETYGTAQYVPMDEKHPYIPSTPYAASKVAADQLCLSYAKTYGIDLSILRPFNNYGPRQNEGLYAGIIPLVVKKVLKGDTIEIYGDGKQTRDYIFVKDTVKAFIRIYKSKSCRNRIINIASGSEITINKLVKLILNIMDAKGVKVRHVAPRPADVRRHCASVKLAKELIGFKPNVNFESGLRMTIQWYIETIGKEKVK